MSNATTAIVGTVIGVAKRIIDDGRNQTVCLREISHRRQIASPQERTDHGLNVYGAGLRWPGGSNNVPSWAVAHFARRHSGALLGTECGAEQARAQRAAITSAAEHPRLIFPGARDRKSHTTSR